MKSKIVSLSKNEEFKSILGGKKISNKYLTIFFKKLSDKNNKKLNISFVAKKKIGNAVSRNKIKRRLKNIMNDAVKNIKINFNYSYLLIARKTVLEDAYKEIKEKIFLDFGKIRFPTSKNLTLMPPKFLSKHWYGNSGAPERSLATLIRN